MRYIGLALISLFLGFFFGTEVDKRVEEQIGKSYYIASILITTAIFALPLFGIALLIWG